MVKSNAGKIIEKIRELPPLPLVVQKLLKVVGDSSSSASDVTKVLASDQAFTAKILKLVNSSFYGFPRQITTLSRAVVILGNSAIRNLAIGTAAYETLKKVRGALDWESFWQHSIAGAVGAQTLAAQIKYPDPEEAFIAGLLHDIGGLIQALTFPEEYARLNGTPPAEMLAAETERFALNHVEAGTRLFEYWKLPEQLCRVVRFHHAYKMASIDKEPLLTLVMLADMLAGIKNPWQNECVDNRKFSLLSKVIQIPGGEYPAIFEKIGQRLNEAYVMLEIAQKPDAAQAATPSRKEPGVAAVLASDENRAAFTAGLLRYLGYEASVIDAAAMAATDYSTCQLLLIDPDNLESGALQGLVTRLQETQIPAAVMTDEAEGQASILSMLPPVAVLPRIFSAEKISALTQGIMA